MRIDTPKELEYYRHGGILQYVLRSSPGRPGRMTAACHRRAPARPRRGSRRGAARDRSRGRRARGLRPRRDDHLRCDTLLQFLALAPAARPSRLLALVAACRRDLRFAFDRDRGRLRAR